MPFKYYGLIEIANGMMNTHTHTCTHAHTHTHTKYTHNTYTAHDIATCTHDTQHTY